MQTDIETGPRSAEETLGMPCEHFALIGLEAVLNQIGRSEPIDDLSEELDSEQASREMREAYAAARKADAEAVLEFLRSADSPRPLSHGDGAQWAGFILNWPDRVPSLKVWSGNQTLAKIIRERQKAILTAKPMPAHECSFPRQPEPVRWLMSHIAPLKGASGLDRLSARTAIEMGFDPAGMFRETRVAIELLAIIGAQHVAFIPYDFRRIGYIYDGYHWSMRIEKRGDYYGRWQSCERFSRCDACELQPPVESDFTIADCF